jgi:linoleoyl-CoA desaturase
MTQSKSNSLRFSNEENTFYSTVRERAHQYFHDNQISIHGNSEMVFKTVAMITLYLGPFVLALTVIHNPFVFWLMWIIMGFGAAGIGLCIMHDANHGSYSSNKKVNTTLGHVLYLLGGCSSYWKIQHNVLHHTYTNVHGYDEDISRAPILRFSPHAKKKKIHRFQHYYAWFLYCLMTISWITSKEFMQVQEFRKAGMLKGKNTYRKMLMETIATKIFYYGYLLVLPMLILPFSPWFILLCFVSMHFVSGLMLSLVFQPAHVIPNTEYPQPDEEGRLENNWAIHQILTTANFGQKQRVLSWFLGGLNFQIEHHLFPSICHVHYRKLAPIVEQTAKEFNLPYYSEKTWWGAIRNHGSMLRTLAKN